MNGVEIVGQVLTGKGVVADGNIMGGVLDAGTTLPAVLLTTVSSVDTSPLRRGTKRRTTDRVQATVKAASYGEKRDVLRRLRAVCDDVFGNFAGMTEVTIHLDGIGPDFEPGPEGIFEQAQDLIVSFNEAR